MIKHVYLIQLKDRRFLAECMEQIRSLKEHIPEIFRIEVGADFSKTSASYDIIEICEFQTPSDFEIFTPHPYHDTIRKYIGSVKKHAVKVDYITEP